MKEHDTVAIYCRLSKEDIDKEKTSDESESIQNQKLLLMDHAVKNGFLIHDVYVDEDLSGFSDRPGFKRMIKDAAAGLFNTIICKSQSRFTRDMELVERYIHGYFVEWGIRFIGLTDNIDTNVKGNKKARQIYGLINEWYSEDLSHNIRSVFKKKMEDGQFIGAFACYGYAKDPCDKHKLIIDEEAASVVRSVFQMCLNGYGAAKIATVLTEQRIPTPTQHKRNQGLKFNSPNVSSYSIKHGSWGGTTIRRILSNEAYVGVLIQGREKKISYKSKKVVVAPKNEWVVIENNHEPIIDKEDFTKVQQLLKTRRRSVKDHCNITNLSTEKELPHLLAGKVKCAECGANMVRNGMTRDKSTHYLRCMLSAKTNRRECSPHFVKQGELEAVLLESIRELIALSAVSGGDQEIINNVKVGIEGRVNPLEILNRQLIDVNTKLEEAQRHLISAYKDKNNGFLDETEFLIFKENFESEKQVLESKRKHLEQDKTDMELKQRNRENISLMLKKYVVLDTLSHEIVNDFVEAIYVSVIGKSNKHNKYNISIAWNF